MCWGTKGNPGGFPSSPFCESINTHIHILDPCNCLPKFNGLKSTLPRCAPQVLVFFTGHVCIPGVNLWVRLCLWQCSFIFLRKLKRWPVAMCGESNVRGATSTAECGVSSQATAAAGVLLVYYPLKFSSVSELIFTSIVERITFAYSESCWHSFMVLRLSTSTSSISWEPIALLLSQVYLT